MGSYRGALREAADILVATGFVPERLDVEEVADRLWFCFGIAAWRTLLNDAAGTTGELNRGSVPRRSRLWGAGARLTSSVGSSFPPHSLSMVDQSALRP
ncbi:hypothetical protein LP52_17365 [Streptomonospora alba]|uniref:Uncharacterized protein n=1 Tax=Streptomonospora alba TaxID=183763 RepID=A0A0C2J8J3_9ACTN|nr:hypothetical protein LP52_17365 [Streptomonospora alba]